MADESMKIDSISSLPDAILQHILCFVPTRIAIRTSVLSKRWRHVWCYTPSLSFYDIRFPLISDSFIDKTLAHYRALNMMNFYFSFTNKLYNNRKIDRWIKFAMSRNVENLSLDFFCPSPSDLYEFPDFFFVNSSVKKLTLKISFWDKMIPKYYVSWPSLQMLYLGCCTLSDESVAKILYGCPLLETLTLYFCDKLEVLDLSKSLSLRTLVVDRNIWVSRPTQIVAPHIHCLRLRNSQLPCTLVDVSSLTEAKLDICFSPFEELKAESLQVMVLKMLEKLQNVEKLTFGGNFLEILSLAEIRGVLFPKFKVKELTLGTVICPYIIPGIERLLQNSPYLKKLTLRQTIYNSITGEYLNKYLKWEGLSDPDQCWKSKDGVIWNESERKVESTHVTSLLKLMLKNTRTLDKMAVQLDERFLKFNLEELVVPPTLSHNNNVTICALQQ